MSDAYGRVFTIGVGGAAGDGVREAANTIGTLLAELGYEVFISFSYPSLIRGGHNFARVSFSTEPLGTDHEKLDVLIALNDETVNLHRAELQPEGVVLDENLVPMKMAAQALGAPEITRSSAALGALCYLWDLPIARMTTLLHQVFGTSKFAAQNVQLAGGGYDHLRAANFRHTKKLDPAGHNSAHRELLDGNTAVGRGLMAAGLDFYFAYPMTPTTSLLHFLARQKEVKTVQPESELAVINMALGAAYAGKRAAVGSASGGFALMQEAFSLAGGAEIPLVVVVSQRQAPATGVPTFSSQADLRFVLHAGHGEFPRLVLAPGDVAEAFALGALALRLAWQYQLPAIILLDKIVSEHAMTASLPVEAVQKAEAKLFSPGTQPYARYELVPDGVSPLAFPGTPHVVVKTNSYEHSPSGLTTEDASLVKSMVEKRFTKGASLQHELFNHEAIKVFGNRESETAVICFGSTKGPLLEALRYLPEVPRVIQILWLEPFPVEAVRAALRGVKQLIAVEGNHDAQLASLVFERTGIKATDYILQYDSRPFSSTFLTEKLKAVRR